VGQIGVVAAWLTGGAARSLHRWQPADMGVAISCAKSINFSIATNEQSASGFYDAMMPQ
jgi:hypothetical protein